MLSRKYSPLESSVLIETIEKTEEIVNNSAIKEVNSSIKLFLVLSGKCKVVIIIKQKPNKLVEVLKMCCEVLFAIVGTHFFQKLKITRSIIWRLKSLKEIE
jgi:hypothetical protein